MKTIKNCDECEEKIKSTRIKVEKWEYDDSHGRDIPVGESVFCSAKCFNLDLKREDK